MKKYIATDIINNAIERGYSKVALILNITQGHGGYSSSSGQIAIDPNNIKLGEDYMTLTRLGYTKKDYDYSNPKKHSKFVLGVEDGEIDTLILEYDTILMIGLID